LKKISLIIFSVIIISISLISTSYASAKSEIRTLVKRYNMTNATIGIYAQRTKSYQELYAYAQDKKLTPASNNKIFTSVAALFILPKDFRYETSIWFDEKQKKGNTLNGDLYLHFTGDPDLTGAKLNKLIKKLKTQQGISTITGDIYLTGTFSGPYIPKGWSKTDQTFCYGAPTSSYNLNRNCMTIILKKANHLNTKVKRLSNTTNIDIINTTHYTSKSGLVNILMSDQNKLYLRGYLARRAEMMFKIAIRNPALKTMDTVDDFLKNNSIKYKGKLSLKSKILHTKTKQVTFYSDYRNHYIKQALRLSDNFYAETLLNTLGLQNNGYGSTTGGIKAVKSVVSNDLKMLNRNLKMFDGSGLSALDKVTPRFMTTFLSKTFNSKVGQEFYSLLPKSGMHGTLAYRMSVNGLLGRVRAKTGTLEGASSLSGYLVTKKDHRISFSIIINDLDKKDRNNARRFQDKVVEVFYRNL